MAKSRRAKGANIFVWILLGLLILGLAGFGIGNFTNSVSTIGAVGDEEITVDDYYQQLQEEINVYARLTGQRLTGNQAVRSGLGQRALETLVLEAVIDNEAADVGISVSDETIFTVLSAMPQFRGDDGTFNRDSYNFVLDRLGLTAAEFDLDIRQAETRALIETTVSGGIPPSEPLVSHLMDYYLTSREVTWAAIPDEIVANDIPEPGEEDLRRYYNENEPEFTRPEIRHLTVAWINPDMIADADAIPESRVRDLYDQRQTEFSRPERRDISRLVFPDLQQAQAAKERLDTSDITYEELASDMGVVLADISLGPVTRETLTDAAADAIFTSESAEIVGPVESTLGPALFQINAILGAHFTPFEVAKDGLARELALEDAQSAIVSNISGYEDLLAGGATIEELASETELRLETIDFDENVTAGIAGFAAFRNAALAATADDFPEITELPGGGLFALRLDRISEPELQPFDDVRNEVIAGWNTQIVAEKLEARAREIADAMNTGSTFADFALSGTTAEAVTRTGFFPDVPATLVETAFAADIGDTSVYGFGREWGVLYVRSETPFDESSENAAQTLNALNTQLTAAIARDTIALYSNQVRLEAGLQLELEVIDAIHAQLP
ncbi:MAG: SurA N-terminal domain-containing protein [Rhodobacteraceae bacterium]|nr:SurA N-terminal domain-containing protein [Paracoccaceae bacterium]